MTAKERLTFTDGILLCNHIYQCAIDKTLQGVFEQEEIFYKTHDILKDLTTKSDKDITRLEELLFTLNMENVYTKV